MIYAGIDAGSRAIKIVLWDHATHQVLAWGYSPQGSQPARHVQETYSRLLAEQHLAAPDVQYVVATGYARAGVEAANTTITEITCHAAGVHHLLPAVRTVVEIGEELTILGAVVELLGKVVYFRAVEAAPRWI